MANPGLENAQKLWNQHLGYLVDKMMYSAIYGECEQLSPDKSREEPNRLLLLCKVRS